MLFVCLCQHIDDINELAIICKGYRKDYSMESKCVSGMEIQPYGCPFYKLEQPDPATLNFWILSLH